MAGILAKELDLAIACLRKGGLLSADVEVALGEFLLAHLEVGKAAVEIFVLKVGCRGEAFPPCRIRTEFCQKEPSGSGGIGISFLSRLFPSVLPLIPL